jgi:large subunit ribosomal protein L24
MKTFSTVWKSSKRVAKQRKYAHNAPLHLKGKFLNAPVSAELQKKTNMKTLRVRKGDKVKVLRGQFKGLIGAVESVSLADSRIFIPKAEVIKKDGAKVKYPIHASNVQLVELGGNDKRRLNA